MTSTHTSGTTLRQLRKWFTGYLPMLVLCTGILLLNSCNDDDDDPASPSITSLSPDTGYEGTIVTIAGSGFSTNSSAVTVKFNTQSATVTSSTATEIVTTVPAGLTLGSVEVTVTVDNRVSNVVYFTLSETPVASITSISPETGPAGTEVTITGSNFSTEVTGNAVMFGSVVATVASATATQLVTTVPEELAAGIYAVTVTTSGHTATSPQTFEVTVPEVKTPSLYWIGSIEGLDNVMKATKNSSGEFTYASLYAPSSADVLLISTLARDRDSQFIYWVEQVLNFDTWANESTIWKGDTVGTTPTQILGGADGLVSVNAMAVDAANDKLYWADGSTLWRANLDGSTKEQLFSSSTFINLLALSVNSTAVYFIDQTNEGSVVYQGSLNGTGTPEVVMDVTDAPAEGGSSHSFISIAVTEEFMFIADQPSVSSDKSEILKATLGATPTPEILYQSTLDESDYMDYLVGVALDPETGYLYWINRGSSTDDGAIYRGDPAASALPELVLEGLTLPERSTIPVNGRKGKTSNSFNGNISF